MRFVSFLFQKLWLSRQEFVGPLPVHLTLNVSLLEFACVQIAPMMEERCVAQMERLTTTFVSFRRLHVKPTPL